MSVDVLLQQSVVVLPLAANRESNHRKKRVDKHDAPNLLPGSVKLVTQTGTTKKSEEQTAGTKRASARKGQAEKQRRHTCASAPSEAHSYHLATRILPQDMPSLFAAQAFVSQAARNGPVPLSFGDFHRPNRKPSRVSHSRPWPMHSSIFYGRPYSSYFRDTSTADLNPLTVRPALDQRLTLKFSAAFPSLK